MNPVRIAFIGCGNIARYHADRLAKVPGAKVVAFSDVDRPRAAALADKHGGHVYDDYRQMLDRETPDAVLLLTPHFVRREPIAEIASRKVALFCEKPPAFTIDEARACAKIIADAGILNTCGLMYRWAGIADKVRECIGGRPVSVCQITGCWYIIEAQRATAKRKNIEAWLLKHEKSGGPMMEQGIHLLDAARYILQDDVVEVHGMGSNLLVPQAEDLTIHDTVMANLRFAKGTLGTHVHSWSHSGWIFQIRFIGADFELLWDIAGNRMSGTVRGVEVKFDAKDDPYDNEFSGFVKAVAAGEQTMLRCTYADACKSFAATLAVVKSAESGKPQSVQW